MHKGLHSACTKSAYCRTARGEAASWLTEHCAAVKMEYLKKNCEHLLQHFLLKQCAATADLYCCLISVRYWCFSIHIVMEICSVQCKPDHNPILSFKRQRKLLYIVAGGQHIEGLAFQNVADSL